ncbi:hypothetical protein QA601_17430 [Chitinispirillales bacterium ANBcel5]|uniref:hypothetical protein n=1 Tax=Cellulosispirillum alkaliphilum TaxID=3039283 RepID=UPI002A514291|nr:hypothetical protein [Chitinispirillales bacterium ANBcel5]
MKIMLSGVFLLLICLPAASQIAGPDYFKRTVSSYYGGLSIVTGNDYYDPGFTLGANFLFRPIEYLGIGLAPSFNRWTVDEDDYRVDRASDNSISLYGAARGIYPTPTEINPYLQIGTGVNLMMNITKFSDQFTGMFSGEKHHDFDVYWGMTFTGGVSYKILDLGFAFSFINLERGTKRWISITLGYVPF